VLDKFIESEEAKPALTKYFVLTQLTYPDDAGTKGSGKVLERVGGASQGFPFHAFLDSKGELIVNSKRNGQDNIGYPLEPQEIEWFLIMVKKAAPKITEMEVKSLETKLRSYKRK
jgi:uncharacterized protein YmfQ (DUF2313 family)